MPRIDVSNLARDAMGSRRAAAGDSDTQPRNVRKVLVISLAGQSYGIGLDVVLEVLPMPLLSRPPGLPPVLAGFLNLGGTVVGVLKLASLFGLAEPNPQLYTPLVLVRCDEQLLALMVDAVEGIASVDEERILPFRENDCALGLVVVGDSNVILLSSRQLLQVQEQRRLMELAAVEQSRLASFQEVPA